MSSENGTVAEICAEMRRMPQDWIVDANANFVFVRYADRIEAAHKREVEHRALIAGVSLADAVDEEHKREVAELQRRLKVAEDALESAWMYASKLPHQWPLPERVRAKMKNALAEASGESEVKE